MSRFLDFRLNQETGDVRSLLGMNTRIAYALVAFFIIAQTTQFAMSSAGLTSLWPGIFGLILLALCGFALLTVSPDPLPLGVTIAMVVAMPLAVFGGLHAAPGQEPSAGQMWFYGGYTMVCTYMCVRGRVGWAWAAMVLIIGATMLWATQTGQGPLVGFARSSVNLGPLLMSTLFAASIRPAAKNIYQIRQRSVDQNASRAAAVAALQERDVQIDRLNTLVRPTLKRIAQSTPLTDDERDECRKLEAQLRDSLRAPILAGTRITADAAARARDRGVEVIMVDGHALDDAAPEVCEHVLDGLAQCLDATTGGSIVVRVLPPDRSLTATVVIDPTDAIPTRVEFLADGTCRTESAAPESAVAPHG